MKTSFHSLRRSPQAGFSLIEVVLVVAIIGILAASAFIAIEDVSSSVRHSKLKNDVAVINEAIDVYLASGGSLAGVSDPQAVLNKLKTRRSAESAMKHAGLDESMLDARLRVRMMSVADAATKLPRAIWDSSANRFQVVTSGRTGIEEFYLDETLAGVDFGTEDRAGSAIDYNDADGWIWKHDDGTTIASLSPTVVTPGSGSSGGGSGSGGTGGGGSGGSGSSGGGSGSTGGGGSDSGSGDGTNTGGGSGPDGDKGHGNDEDGIDEDNPGKGKGKDDGPGQLASPSIQSSGPAFNFSIHETIHVTLSDPNAPNVSTMEFQLDNGPWQTYSGPFTLDAVDYPDGVTISAQALPVPGQEAFYLPSSVSQAFLAGRQAGRLAAPDIEFDFANFDIENGVHHISVTLTNPNDPDDGKVMYRILPVPGGPGSPTAFAEYNGQFSVARSDYSDGFGVEAYVRSVVPEFLDSYVNELWASDAPGTFGGHLDLDTSDFLAEIGNGSTSQHTHDITSKYNLSAIDFLNIPEEGHIEINEAISNGNQAFKILAINGDLSPGLSLEIRHVINGQTEEILVPVTEYDDTALSSLPVYTFSGKSGTAKLLGVTLRFNKNILYEAGVVPTNTGDAKKNILGKGGEWRNGAFTLQAVAVKGNGDDDFTTNTGLSAGGVQGAATSGLLWEGFVFWHWGGDSYHNEGNQFVAGDVNSVAEYLDGFETLQSPGFSPTAGEFEYTQFPISVTITNPNSGDHPGSYLVYSVNGGSEDEYEGTFTVGYDSIVSAYADDDGSFVSKSPARSAYYQVKDYDLKRPSISLSDDKFADSSVITVTVTNPNPAELSQVIYWLEGQTEADALLYEGPFTVSSTDHPGGVKIFAKAIGTEGFVVDSNSEDEEVK